MMWEKLNTEACDYREDWEFEATVSQPFLPKTGKQGIESCNPDLATSGYVW